MSSLLTHKNSIMTTGWWGQRAGKEVTVRVLEEDECDAEEMRKQGVVVPLCQAKEAVLDLGGLGTGGRAARVALCHPCEEGAPSLGGGYQAAVLCGATFTEGTQRYWGGEQEGLHSRPTNHMLPSVHCNIWLASQLPLSPSSPL